MIEIIPSIRDALITILNTHGRIFHDIFTSSDDHIEHGNAGGDDGYSTDPLEFIYEIIRSHVQVGGPTPDEWYPGKGMGIDGADINPFDPLEDGEKL